MNVPVFDFHCDTPSALAQGAALNTNNLHIDLQRAGQLAGYAQCFACFTTPNDTQDPILMFERQLAAILRELQKNSSIICQAYSTDEIEKNLQNNLMSAVLTIEGPAGFGYDPALLEDLYQIGFRITTLCWNESNPLTGSHITGEGLTDRGRAYVEEAQRLGMLVDVSHISDRGFWDIIEITQAPIIATHSNSRKIHNVSRNLTDDMFAAICRTGGVVGINQYADFLGTTPTMDTVCDHVLHFLELDPSGKHIALGGDLDGCDRLSADFNGIQDYPALADKLLSCGLSEATVQDIFWNNAIEVMKKCCI